MEKNQFKPFDQVLARDNKEGSWKVGIYSHCEEKSAMPHICVGSRYTYCIPYSEETKHLLGTSLPYEKSVKEPKEYHVWTSGTFNQWFTKAEFENFIKTAVINNKDIKDFHVLYVKHND